MSNPFKYFKDKKEIWADWKQPDQKDYNFGYGHNQFCRFTSDRNTYNSRPHFTVSPEPDWEDEKIVEENIHFSFSRKFSSFSDWTVIAIPLPKEPSALNKFLDEADKYCQVLEQQDIPMDSQPINNLNNIIMQWIEKYLIEDYGRKRWNKMTREEQAIILNNFLNDLVKAIEKIREIKLKQ